MVTNNNLPDIAGVVAGVQVADVVDHSEQHVLVVTKNNSFDSVLLPFVII